VHRNPCLVCIETRALCASKPVPCASKPVPMCIETRAYVHRNPCLVCIETRALCASKPVPCASKPVPMCIETRAYVHRNPCLFATRQGRNPLDCHGVPLDAVAFQKTYFNEFVQSGAALSFETGRLRVPAPRQLLQGG
jgi:hypothetical protein